MSDRAQMQERIRELEAEVERLRADDAVHIGMLKSARAEVERLRKVYDDIEGQRLMLLDERDAACKSAAALRTALRDLVKKWQDGTGGNESKSRWWREMEDLATAAENLLGGDA